MPRPGTPAARAMAADNVRTGMSNPWRYDPNERVPGAPAPRPVRLSNTSPRPRSGVIPVASLPATRGGLGTTLNEFGFPAKDRSGRLTAIEPAHLGRLMDKIRGPLAGPPAARLDF